jgi:hypothetical protein
MASCPVSSSTGETVMVYFNSTAIHGAAYDTKSSVLYLQFTSGARVYDYPGVPQYIFDGLLAASSKGVYFNRYIRDQYSANR